MRSALPLYIKRFPKVVYSGKTVMVKSSCVPQSSQNWEFVNLSTGLIKKRFDKRYKTV
jgi:acyl dehydratase